MNILLLAPASNIHTQRWANGLVGRGLEVHVASIHKPLPGYAPQVHLHNLHRICGAASYFTATFALKRLLREQSVDLVNAHYASGYGTLARLARVHPLIVSVWGSDVYDFPRYSFLHRWWLRKNLSVANEIASTSHAMARQTTLWCDAKKKEISVTPFGVDTNKFHPSPRDADGVIRIGTVKTLQPKYGVDILLKAFALLRSRLDPELANRLRLDIVGQGSQRLELESLAKTLGIANVTEFSGFLPHDEIPKRLATFDIYAALSRLDSESFGVAVLEASACGIPVVVSNVGGLPEVVEDGRTGIIVPREAPDAAALAFERLLQNPELARGMGDAGREHVESNYSWEKSLDIMIDVYRSLLKKNGGYNGN